MYQLVYQNISDNFNLNQQIFFSVIFLMVQHFAKSNVGF